MHSRSHLVHLDHLQKLAPTLQGYLAQAQAAVNASGLTSAWDCRAS
jgi:hypothetical protein